MEQSSTIRTDIFGAIEPHPPVPKSKLVSNSQSDDQKKAELKEDEARQSTSNVPMILGICIAVTGALAGIVIGFRVGLARLRRQEQDGMVVGESEGTGIDSTLPDRKSQHLDLLYTSTYQHDYGVQAE